MMLRAILLVAAVAAPAAFATGLWQGQRHVEAPPAAGVRINAPLVAKPGSGAADAGRYFAVLNAPPPPPPPPPPAKPPPPPPPPDVAVLFRRDLSAVLPGYQPRVVLAGSRSLRPGEVYRDGWVISAITPSTVVLAKGNQERRIGVFSPPPAGMTQVAAAPPPAVGPQISFTNGSSAATRPNPGQIAGVVGALGAAGMNPDQLQRISSMLAAGTFNQGAATQMLGQMNRNRPMTPQQVANVTQAMQRAGVLQPAQAQALSRSLPQTAPAAIQNNPGGGNRGGGGGGRNRQPNAGFGGTTLTQPPTPGSSGPPSPSTVPLPAIPR